MKDNSNKTNVARQVELIIRQLTTLSTLPEVAAGFLSNLAGGKVNSAGLNDLVESDPALTARILSLAFTEGVSFKDNTPSVSEALAKLSDAVVRDAIFSVKVFEAFDADYDPDSGRSLPRKQMALHALATACCAKRIAELVLPEEDRKLAFSAGLLHDIGKLAIDQVMPKSFERMVEQARREGAALYDIERKHLGVDHMLVGKRLAEKWHLPEEVTFSIWMHHSDTETLAGFMSAGKIAQVVRLADIIARQCGIGDSGSYDNSESPAEILENLSISAEQIEDIRQGLAEDVSQRSELLGLGQPGGQAQYCKVLHETASKLSSDNTQLAGANRQLSASSVQLEFVRKFENSINSQMSPLDVAQCFAVLCKEHYQMGPVCVYLPCEGGEPSIEAVLVDDAGHVETRLIIIPDGAEAIASEMSGKFAIGETCSGISWLVEQLDMDVEAARVKAGALMASNRAVGAIIFEQRLPADVAELTNSMAICTEVAAKMIELAAVGQGHRSMSEQFVSLLGELKHSREQLIQVRSIAGVAEMAAGAAHELNNPLAVISGRAQLLFDIETDSNKKQMLGQIQMRTKEIADIVEDLMSFARPKQPVVKDARLGSIIDSAVKQAIAETKRDEIEMDIEGVDLSCHVLVDAVQMSGAIANLLVNAMESYPGGSGPVTIDGTCGQKEGFMVFCISDSGCGMEPEVLSRATEPFYSVKPAGRKRGMGLTHAKRLIGLNGGTINIVSEPGKGTKVTVSLPLI